MNIPKNHKEFIRLVSDGIAQDEAYLVTIGNNKVTKATARSKGSALAKKYALEIQELKKKASNIVEEANKDKDVKNALKLILTKAEVDAQICNIIKGDLQEVQMLNNQGKVFKAKVSPTISERTKAIEVYYKRFGLNEAEKVENTIKGVDTIFKINKDGK